MMEDKRQEISEKEARLEKALEQIYELCMQMNVSEPHRTLIHGIAKKALFFPDTK